MAERPWVTPEDVKEYTDYKAVKDRSDAKLDVDIFRAESYVIAYTHNDFSGTEVVPQAVKTAVILVAEVYAVNASNSVASGQFKSETFDDYSYTLADNPSIDLDSLNLGELLDEFVLKEKKGGIDVRLRRL